MYDKPLERLIDAVKLFFAPVRERSFRLVFAVILVVSTVMGIIEVYKPFDQ